MGYPHLQNTCIVVPRLVFEWVPGYYSLAKMTHKTKCSCREWRGQEEKGPHHCWASHCRVSFPFHVGQNVKMYSDKGHRVSQTLLGEREAVNIRWLISYNDFLKIYKKNKKNTSPPCVVSLASLHMIPVKKNTCLLSANTPLCRNFRFNKPYICSVLKLCPANTILIMAHILLISSEGL